jgi:hypothetical protein
VIEPVVKRSSVAPWWKALARGLAAMFVAYCLGGARGVVAWEGLAGVVVLLVWAVLQDFELVRSGMVLYGWHRFASTAWRVPWRIWCLGDDVVDYVVEGGVHVTWCRLGCWLWNRVYKRPWKYL